MRSVIPNQLWIGNAREARDLSLLAELGIQAVVDLAANEPPAVLLRDVVYCRIPLVDGDGNLPELVRLAVTTVEHLLREGVPTLVSCSYGMSRSPTVTAFALARLRSITPMEALSIVGGSVSPAMWESAVTAMRD
jgi:protein-tyrosine phosphatase